MPVGEKLLQEGMPERKKEIGLRIHVRSVTNESRHNRVAKHDVKAEMKLQTSSLTATPLKMAKVSL